MSTNRSLSCFTIFIFTVGLFIAFARVVQAAMPVPSGPQILSYLAEEQPAANDDPAQAKPLGFGAVVSGGDTLSVSFGLPSLSGPVDVYGAFVMSADPSHIRILNPDGHSFQTLLLNDVYQSVMSGILPAGVTPWKASTPGPINETLFTNLPVAGHPVGTYTVYALVTPAGNLQGYYLWETAFSVPIVKQAVGAGGGTVSVTDTASKLSDVKIDVPANAVPGTTPFSIAEAVNLPEFPFADSLQLVAELGPTGTIFNTPVTVTMPYNPASVANESLVRVFTFDLADGAWVAQKTATLDTVNKTVSAYYDHFSPAAVAEKTATGQLFDMQILKMDSTGGLAARVVLKPSLAQIETAFSTYLGTGCANLKCYVDTLPFDLHLNYSVKLIKKRLFSDEPPVAAKRIRTRLFSEMGDNRVVRIEDANDVLIDSPYINKDATDRWFASEPILFQFQCNGGPCLPEDGAKYYLKVSLSFLEDETCSDNLLKGAMCGYESFAGAYLATLRPALTDSTEDTPLADTFPMASTVDSNLNGIINAYEPAPACTYNYSDWGVCQPDGTQTRTLLSSSPAGCTGTPVLSQNCTYVLPTCTVADVTSWNACQSNNMQIASSYAANCKPPQSSLSQSCTYDPQNVCTLKRQSAETCVFSIPSIGLDGTIYYACDDGKLKAVNPADGSLKWSFQGGSCGDQYRYAATVGDDGTIYVRDPHTLYAVMPSGVLKWKYTTTYSNDGALCEDFPTIGKDGSIYVSFWFPSGVCAFRPDGSVKWKNGHLVPSGLAIGSDGTIYASDDSTIYALDPDDGSIKWFRTVDPLDNLSAGAIGMDGTIYVSNANSKAFSDVHHGNLYAYDGTGMLKWSYLLADEYFLGPPVIGADGTIYATSENQLYALTPTGSVAWKFAPTGGGKIRSTPAIGNDNTIYIPTTSHPAGFYAINPDGSLKGSYNKTCQYCYPIIANDGTILIGREALNCGSTGVANSAWPMFMHDARHTGNVSTNSTPTTCTYTYSNWSSCQNGTQTRTVISASPQGCTGTPGPLTQLCEISSELVGTWKLYQAYDPWTTTWSDYKSGDVIVFYSDGSFSSYYCPYASHWVGEPITCDTALSASSGTWTTDSSYIYYTENGVSRGVGYEISGNILTQHDNMYISSSYANGLGGLGDTRYLKQ